VLDAADVDRADTVARRHAHGVVEAGGDPVAADEVHPGPERDSREHRPALALHQPVHDLVQRPVAADRDDQLGVGAGGELGQMAGPFAVVRLPVEAEPGCAVRKRRPAPTCAAVVGGRVDEERGFNDRT
jgi:hypothetical protein